MPGGGKYIVRRLTEIHFVVGMYAVAGPAFALQQFRCPVGQDLVHVHVGLRSRTGLPYREGKFVMVAAVEDFLGGGGDGISPGMRQQSQIAVGLCACPLDGCQRMNDLYLHAFGGNLEVLDRALCLCAPQTVCENRNRPVVVNARCGHGGYSG